MPQTNFQLIQQLAEQQPEAPALLAPDRQPLTYAALATHIGTIAGQLNQLGLRRNDRVAIILPNGPEAASAFLAISATATAAPLNPNYRQPEYEFFLNDLHAKALVILHGMPSPARKVAADLNIPIIELQPSPQAGHFTLSDSGRRGIAGETAFATPDDAALVLHTSGTTSRPKIVPLSHKNLFVSASNIRKTLQLTPRDRCLNIMPLFHIHGLMAAVSASLTAGASLVCTPGFSAPQFFGWIDHYQPTWYTAVPTMHQAILAHAAGNAAIIGRATLRLIRSSSSSLPPVVMAQLEETFNTPVIESYGMTEAAHQMASNPLPPLARKPGSVGMPAGPDASIMGVATPEILATNQIGEIVIRGSNVTRGYDANPDANAVAFESGWFRTGDQGYLDDDGYLFITGRLKELINRGGEKISPREIDEVLLAHPDVRQALAFAMPDPQLGEEVAAVVVLRVPGVSARDLQQFAAQSLADFKVPRKIVILDEIPKGPTGKLQRIGLAEKLGVTGAMGRGAGVVLAPATAMEKLIHQLWIDVLELDTLGVMQRFLEVGGDSLSAMRLVNLLQHELDVAFSIVDFFGAPTIREQAAILDEVLANA